MSATLPPRCRRTCSPPQADSARYSCWARCPRGLRRARSYRSATLVCRHFRRLPRPSTCSSPPTREAVPPRPWGNDAVAVAGTVDVVWPAAGGGRSIGPHPLQVALASAGREVRRRRGRDTDRHASSIGGAVAPGDAAAVAQRQPLVPDTRASRRLPNPSRLVAGSAARANLGTRPDRRTPCAVPEEVPGACVLHRLGWHRD